MTPVLSVKQRKKKIRKTPLFLADTLTADITAGTTATCDYILHTGMPRGCSAANCDKYVPGKTKQKSIVIFDKLTDEEKAARASQYDALNMRLDQYEIQRRHSKERKN